MKTIDIRTSKNEVLEVEIYDDGMVKIQHIGPDVYHNHKTYHSKEELIEDLQVVLKELKDHS